MCSLKTVALLLLYVWWLWCERKRRRFILLYIQFVSIKPRQTLGFCLGYSWNHTLNNPITLTLEKLLSNLITLTASPPSFPCQTVWLLVAWLCGHMLRPTSPTSLTPPSNTSWRCGAVWATHSSSFSSGFPQWLVLTPGTGSLSSSRWSSVWSLECWVSTIKHNKPGSSLFLAY